MSKFAKFLDKRFKTKKDSVGAPSIIIVEGVDHHLIQSFERDRVKKYITKFLKEKVVLTDDESTKESDSFVDSKYKEYMDFYLQPIRKVS